MQSLEGTKTVPSTAFCIDVAVLVGTKTSLNGVPYQDGMKGMDADDIGDVTQRFTDSHDGGEPVK